MLRYCSTCAVVTAIAAAAFAEPNPSPSPAPPAEQPSTAELLQEIRALRRQMDEQQERHEQELKKLQEQIDALRGNAPSPAGSPAPSPAQASAPESKAAAENELESLISGAAPSAPAAVMSNAPASSAPTTFLSGLQGGIQSFNPDISLNGDFLAAYSSREGGELDDEFLFRELELGFGGAVDPYTSATMIVTLEHEDDEFDVDLEEGYLTFTQLPHGLQARAGKYRADFGKSNSIHLHALPWIDYPFVIKRFFGEEGLSGAGAEVSWVPTLSGGHYVSMEYEVFNNDNDALFAGEEADDFAHLVRAKTFRDLSATSNIELGVSAATAPNDGDHGHRRATVQGIDLTYRWKPQDSGLYRSFLWRTEVMAAEVDRINDNSTALGGYTAGEYQFARRWKFGLRLDITHLPEDPDRRETGYSAYLTFLQSEFVFWRLGYIYTDRNFVEDGNDTDSQIMLQLNWTLGAHPAHKF